MRKRANDRKLSARAPLLSRTSFFTNTEWKVSKYGVFLGQYLPVPVLFSIQENTDQKKLRILKLFKQWKCNLSEIIKFIAVTNCGKIISLPHHRTSYRRSSIKKLFLKILQYSQENTCVGVSFQESWGPAKFLRTHFLQNTFGGLPLFAVTYVSLSSCW